MTSRFANAALFILVSAATVLGQGKLNSLSPAEIADGWILLWDGETTFGWEQAVSAQTQVSDGALRQARGAYSWLRHKTPFADFVLRLDFRMLTEDADSGVFIRAAKEGDPTRTGYQVNINNRNEEYGTGSLVNRAKYNGSMVKAGEWHHYEVTAEGDRIVAILDGKRTIDVRDSMAAFGYVGLQFLKPEEVEFRNIRLKPLGAKSLFNGSDLSGWQKVDRPNVQAPPEWSVRDGAIHVEKGPGQLETFDSYQDFVLQMEVRANALNESHHPNSGVFFRGEKGAFWTGYESQVRNEFKDRDRTQPVDFGTGGLYRFQPARRVVSSDREYFTKTIVAAGRQIAIWVNGVQTADYADLREEGSDLRRQALLKAGPISLQAHDPTTNLDFRNLRIATLPGR